MARLIFSFFTSLDGYVEYGSGGFDWAAPDDEVLAFVNDFERTIGTYLYGRGLYETMVSWETADTIPGQSPLNIDFALLWQAAEKVVYSTTLPAVTTERTRLERSFDPADVQRLKQSAERDITVGGPGLAAHALRTGLVDELHLLIAPVVVGSGKPMLPPGVRLDLDLLEERRFDGGLAYLRYGVRA